VEVLLLIRYREHVTGHVLELGCGAGRITGYLVELAADAHGLDVSADMIAECRRRYPAGHFSQADMRDLSSFESDSLDLVLAGYNLLDIFTDPERRQVLREVRRVLSPTGILIMSSHNRASLPKVRSPSQLRRSDPLRFGFDLLKAPGRTARHRRLRKHEYAGTDYCIVSDGSHDFSLVHYFTSADAQFRQFEQEGFEPLLSADLDGRPLDDTYDAPDCPEIHYVARKLADEAGAPPITSGRSSPQDRTTAAE
jgi:SAM-dependent methyltransferase